MKFLNPNLNLFKQMDKQTSQKQHAPSTFLKCNSLLSADQMKIFISTNSRFDSSKIHE